ncbi:hypothetical protein ACQ86O_04435 [Serratia sp. L9]|uniref:hypothetical protein n=1 Tax=Serratia sp. L9 TaxID=3423946 RepID=UPI003D67D07C
MLNRIVIRACLPGNRQGLLGRFGQHRRTKQALHLLLQQALPLMASSRMKAPIVTPYPWCFVAPANAIRAKHYFIGAFLPETQTSTALPPVLYALVSEAWLLSQLNERDSLPFWLARVLAPFSVGCEVEVHRWCKLLQRMLMGRKHAISANHLRPREGLREERCDADFALGSEHGVDAMPWMEWPGCIQNDEIIWIWRQSRHGKVIESQKLANLNLSELTNK